jgi:hypothetical protein
MVAVNLGVTGGACEASVLFVGRHGTVKPD